MSNTFQTIEGTTIKVKPVSDTLVSLAKASIEREFRQRGEPVDPPTYTVKTASGAEMVEYHDATSVQTPDEIAAWNKHVDAVKRLREAQRKHSLKVRLLRGVEFVMPQDNTWEQEQRQLGVDVPTDETDRKYHYLTTEVLKSPEDYLQAIQAIDTLTYAGTIREDDIVQTMDNFRHILQRSSSFARKFMSGKVASQSQAK